MHIDIFSDTICPWCFIGKKRFEKALAARPELDVTVTWRTFQLNPDMPEEGMDRREYLETKFGGVENARHVYARVAEAGGEEDIEFDFDAIKRTPNTIASHRLIHFVADDETLQERIVSELFDAYFLRGENIGDVEVLVACATAAGLDAAEVRAYLATDEHAHAVRAEDVQARQLGIQGVPFFVIDGRFGVSGAQSPESFLRAFDQVRAEAESTPDT